MKDLTTFTLSVIQELEDEGRFGTAHVYRSMLRYTWAVPNRPSSSSSCMTESVKVVKSFMIC